MADKINPSKLTQIADQKSTQNSPNITSEKKIYLAVQSNGIAIF